MMNQIGGVRYVKMSGVDLKETYMKEVQQFLDKGNPKTMHAESAAFNILLPVSRRRLRKTSRRASKMDSNTTQYTIKS